MDAGPALRAACARIAKGGAGRFNGRDFGRDKGKPVATDHRARLCDKARANHDARADPHALAQIGTGADFCVIADIGLRADDRVHADFCALADHRQRADTHALTKLGIGLNHRRGVKPRAPALTGIKQRG